MGIRVRYAPSPTGFQHIGGIRTALINYLYAKSHGGSFVLRVEDTDFERSDPMYMDDLYKCLQWLSIIPQESPLLGGEYAPYIQSQRLTLYRKYIDQLLEQGDAYYCVTSPQRSDQEAQTPYDRSSRELSEQEIQQYKDKGVVPVVRLKLPLEGSITIKDELLGEITRDVKDIIVDPIILKSDGVPTYHFANVIDDYHMKITHVMRSQEWVPTTPVHEYLYKVLGWNSPHFLHLPMVLGEDGQKLSKRNGSMSITQIRALGVLPEALINCIALLGWAFDDSREFFTMEELIALYKDGKINKAPAKFSMEKLKWFNAHYIRLLDAPTLAGHLMPYLEEKNFLSSKNQDDVKTMISLIPLIQDRLELLSDAPKLLQALFEEVETWNFQSFIEKQGKERVILGLQYARTILEKEWDKDVALIQEIIKSGLPSQKVDEKALKLGQVLMPLRIAITGDEHSPPILLLIKHLGKTKTLHRIAQAIEYVS